MSSLYEFDDTGNTPTNVADEFVGMTTEEIRRKVEDSAGESITICMNLTSDFNKSAILRTHTALGGSDFYIVGKRRFDRRGTVGTHHYSPVHHALTLRPVIDELHARGYTVYAVDNVPAFEPTPVWDVSFPDRSAFLFGEERNGLSPESVEECDRSAFIPMNGIAPRSLNVGHAAAIIIGEYARQHRFGMGS